MTLRLPALLTAALMLFACATAPAGPRIEVREIKIPVPIPCAPTSLGPAPAYPDTDTALLAAPDAAQRYLLIAAGRLLRAARLAELEPVAEACRGP